MIKSELSNISQKTIDLVYQINKFVESRHQFMIDIMKRTLECVKFVIKKYTQKFNKSDESISYQQCVELKSQTSSLQFLSDWAIDRASLWAAICEFDFSTEDLHLDSFNMTDESSVSVNLTKSDVQQMINVAA